jgi:hypothetical protein
MGNKIGEIIVLYGEEKYCININYYDRKISEIEDQLFEDFRLNR